MTPSTVVTGPVTGGRGWPFGGPVADLGRHGYVEEEFFLAGTADRYRLRDGAQLTPDGRWAAEPAGSAPYQTRFVVYRPTDPGAFNGMVILVWNNVSAGYDIWDGADSREVVEGGYAYVAVTAQKVGIEGLGDKPMGLAAWDPQRYGSLTIPSDDYSYDIFTQVARVVGSRRATPEVDPLAGLDVQRVIARGSSQSACRLATYLNAVHPLTGVIDGYLLTVYVGAGMPLEVGAGVLDITAAGTTISGFRGANFLRDTGAKVFVVNSELETVLGLDFRQPDSDWLRTWEVAGTCHTSTQAVADRLPRLQRDFGAEVSGIFAAAASQPAGRRNELPLTPAVEAALHHLDRWVAEGTPPPAQPRLEIDPQTRSIERDEHGLARGEARLPQVEAPVAANSMVPLADDMWSALAGSCVPFPAATLRERYGDRQTYLARFEQAVHRAIDSGVLLPADAPALLAEARCQPWPD